MATYLPNLTDYVPDIQPYQPDWEMIDRTMRLRQNRYDQGYANLQSTYSTLLNIPQLKQDQIDKRDRFLKQAFQNIGDLSSVDLSLAENAKAAQNVFAPLYNDTDFLGNASMSKHYQDQESYADSLRQKDGGKEFSVDNLDYVRGQMQDYIQDNSPDAWKKYYNNKRYYESYYDYSKEIKDSMDKFKPSTLSLTRMNGMYFVKTTDKGAQEDDVRRYLNGALSDKAKRQMQIEASVRLGNNPEALAALYKSTGDKTVNFYSKQLEQINQSIKDTKDPAQIQQLQGLRSQVQENITDTQKHLQNIDLSNLDYVKKNRDSLAMDIYYDDVINRTSKGFSYTDHTEDISENNVAFGMWKDSQEWGRQRAGFQHDEKMKYLEAELKARGEGTGDGVAVNIPTTPEDISEVSLSGIQADISQVKDDRSKLSETVKQHISEVTGIPMLKLSDEAVKSYIDQSKGKDDYIEHVFKPQMVALISKQEAKEGMISSLVGSARETLGKNTAVIDKIDRDLSNVGPLTVNTGSGKVRITPQTVFRALADSEISGYSDDIISSILAHDKIDTKKGKEFMSDPSNLEKLNTIINKVRPLVAKNKGSLDIYNKYSTQADALFTKNYKPIRSGFIYNDDSKPVKEVRGYLSSALPGLSSEKVHGVTYDVADNRVYFTVEDSKTNPIDPEEIVTQLNAKSLDAGYNESTKQFYVARSGIPGTDAFRNFSPVEMNFMEAANHLETYTSPYYYPIGQKNQKGERVPPILFKKETSASGDVGYYLYTDPDLYPGKKHPIGNKRYNNMPDAVLDAKSISQHPETLPQLLK